MANKNNTIFIEIIATDAQKRDRAKQLAKTAKARGVNRDGQRNLIKRILGIK